MSTLIARYISSRGCDIIDFEKILKEIGDAKCFIVVLSKNFFKHSINEAKWEVAKSLGKKIYVLKMPGCKIPEDLLEGANIVRTYELSDKQHIRSAQIQKIALEIQGEENNIGA